MKQYVIDGLRPQDHDRLKAYLDEHVQAAGIVGIYWLPLDDSVLSPVQCNHRDCGPHVFALKLERKFLPANCWSGPETYSVRLHGLRHSGPAELVDGSD